MTVQDICRVHYLSCVEAYFGAWIKYFIPISALYCDSFLSWQEICDAFSEGARYERFTFIPRLQDLAESAGLTKHKKVDGIFNYRLDERRLMLVSVNEKFFPKQKPWRGDHYIAVEEITEKKLRYLNEFPLGKGELTTKDFLAKYGGSTLIYNLCGDDLSVCLDRSEKQRRKLKSITPGENPALSLIPFRDSLGILRVSRKRALSWLVWYANVLKADEIEELKNVLSKQICFADKSYLQVQTMLIRGKREDSVIRSIDSEIRRLDENLKKVATEKL